MKLIPDFSWSDQDTTSSLDVIQVSLKSLARIVMGDRIALDFFFVDYKADFCLIASIYFCTPGLMIQSNCKDQFRHIRKKPLGFLQ